MKELYLSALRNRETKTDEFRRASDQLAQLLCAETQAKLADSRIEIQTPVGTTMGIAVSNSIMVVSILRAGLALLPAFTHAIPNLPVGLLGLERDEETAQARVYYKKFPRKISRRAVILDPMLATGGSACMAVEVLIQAGYTREQIYFTGVVAAYEGFNRLAAVIPIKNIVVGAVDPALNAQKYIVPGLGDYGDRYFGTN
ncbi:MAG: uracil phosphoribosyltransferase [Parcubacteria group bacterium Gr01-1014_66]|nr:MAG: uracil phosphoribosyltransferase [Parcubacteria group bacterium Gr01-1014_66]